MESCRRCRRVFALPLVLLALAAGAAPIALGACGPFSDVSDAGFCPFVLELFTLGITTGTSATTYDPAANVTRLQMAAFLSRTVDGVLLRGGRRAALDQFWTPQAPINVGVTDLVNSPRYMKSDGTDVWVPIPTGAVQRVSGADGRVLGTWTGAGNTNFVLVAMGRIFGSAQETPGKIYRIDPRAAPTAVTTLASNLADNAFGMAFDGGRIWVGGSSGISIVTPTVSLPWTVTIASSGMQAPVAPVFDGKNIWTVDQTASALLKLDAAGAVLQTVTVGTTPFPATFDGTNFWVPAQSNSVTVIRASSGAIVTTLTGNGLNNPRGSAFDGQRILVANTTGSSVSLWKAADLTPLGSFQMGVGTGPVGVCSDGVSFWVGLNNVGQIARF